ncbi:hypothetical protein PCE1_003049 [Barthelona sp. PCE]
MDVSQMKIHAIQPRTRAERQMTSDKEQIEKNHLKGRSGNYYAYDGGIETMYGEKGTPGYIQESERFSSNFTNYHKEQRDADINRRNESLQARRNHSLRRDEQRFQQLEENYKRDERKVEFLQQRQKTRRSEAFNPITLELNDNAQGQELAHQDDMSLDRMKRRRVELYTRSNGRYNPITGEEVNLPGIKF